jgi:hypothetical protein
VFTAGSLYPVSHIVQNQVARGAGSSKADQWRSQINVLFVGLFDAWQVNGQIPEGDAPPSAPNTKLYAAQAAMEKLLSSRRVQNLLYNNPTATAEEIEEVEAIKPSRSLRRHYDVVVQFSASLRMLFGQTVTPDDIQRGNAALERSLQEWARMGCHLTPYFHFSIHIAQQLLRTGPCYSSSAWAYERNNGFLGRFNNNGHSGGEMEGTMFRGWWKTIFIQNLVYLAF